MGGLVPPIFFWKDAHTLGNLRVHLSLLPGSTYTPTAYSPRRPSTRKSWTQSHKVTATAPNEPHACTFPKVFGYV